jgi:membrane protein YqaA with SNARE-associated domain/outer membrane lipoprotein-sorting protein
MSFLSSVLQRLVAILEPYGAPGLLLIAIADSSFISLPEVNDLALMTLSIANPSRMWILATCTVIGSIIGCTLLYTVGRKGGEALLNKRFAAAKVARVRAWYDKYGMLAIIVPSLLPPPLPFKIFVLCAGAFRISWAKFMIAVGIGRSIRYFTEGMLAVWYGKQAIQMVKDNSGRVGLVLASLIVLATLIFVYSRRRRVPASVLLLPVLLTLLFSGCVRTQVIPPAQRMLKSYPFTRAQALAKLDQMSKAVQSFQTPMELEGFAMMGEDTRKKSPVLDGTFIMRRPDRIYLRASYLVPVFEMRSDGVDYEIYVNQKNRVYRGKENGPPSKPLPDLGDVSNRLINLRPKQILDALALDVTPLLNNPSIMNVAYESPFVQDRRRYFVVDFTEKSEGSNGRLLQKIWFDLSMENPEVVRRQTFDKDGGIEADVFYRDHKPLRSGTMNYPSTVELQFVETETILLIKLDPKNVQLNVDVDPEAFMLSTHKDAQVITFEPKDLVSQQR